jgi:hypothetical protein
MGCVIDAAWHGSSLAHVIANAKKRDTLLCSSSPMLHVYMCRSSLTLGICRNNEMTGIQNTLLIVDIHFLF